MFYYRYDEEYILIEKSSEPLTGDNVVTCDEDIDIQLFKVIVGFISEKRVMLRHTKIIRDSEAISRQLTLLREDLSNAQAKSDLLSDQQAEKALETDYRLSLLELGLA